MNKFTSELRQGLEHSPAGNPIVRYTSTVNVGHRPLGGKVCDESPIGLQTVRTTSDRLEFESRCEDPQEATFTHRGDPCPQPAAGTWLWVARPVQGSERRQQRMSDPTHGSVGPGRQLTWSPESGPKKCITRHGITHAVKSYFGSTEVGPRSCLRSRVCVYAWDSFGSFV